MIRAFAVAGRALSEPRYTQAAARAAQYLLDHHRMADGSLIRTTRPATFSSSASSAFAISVAPAKCDASRTQRVF